MSCVWPCYPGDLIYVAIGDVIPADIISDSALHVDQSYLAASATFTRLIAQTNASDSADSHIYPAWARLEGFSPLSSAEENALTGCIAIVQRTGRAVRVTSPSSPPHDYQLQ